MTTLLRIVFRTKNKFAAITQDKFFFDLLLSIKIFFKKLYAVRTNLNEITKTERALYEQIQRTFSHQKFLYHFDSTKVLYADINAFKSHDFEAIIYHISVSCDDSFKISRINVQFIIFLSKMFTDVKKKY